MRVKEISLIIFMSIILQGCLALDGGYRVSDYMHPNQTHGLLDYNQMKYSQGLTQKDIKKYIGEYRVIKSWSNSLYKISKIKISNENEKITLYLFRSDWTNPSYKIEFASCSLSESGDKYFKNIKSGIFCVNYSNRERPILNLFESTKNTTAWVQHEVALTGGEEVKITTKYGAWIHIWLDAAGPILSLEKVK
jgi:hypothetical protein